MAEELDTYDFNEELGGIIPLLWGTAEIKEDVFRRWSQAFVFLPHEPTALIQYEGGPCAVIASVQAFILRALIAEKPEVGDWLWQDRDVPSSRPCELLVTAICDILSLASTDNTFKVVHMCPLTPTGSENEREEEDEELQHGAAAIALRIPSGDHRQFHARISVRCFEDIEDVRNFYCDKFEMLMNKFAVIMILYSVIATKGLAMIKEEVNDASEPLIESVYGYGSQSLINLMLTGRAVGHVWDLDKDVGGMQLKGISCQGDVGYLALLEHMRYCEVGSFLKNPRSPVWVLASETHLTVLFSPDQRLVSPETAPELARRVFRTFDPDGNNFITATHLQDVLRELELVSEPEYVEIMVKKLDAENLGIILLHAFLDEFFPETVTKQPDTFVVFHYNGLPNSHPDNSVRYEEGTAVILESDVLSVLDGNAMLTCLQTKWPNIEVSWASGRTPSLN